jgi:hypothetical protein
MIVYGALPSSIDQAQQYQKEYNEIVFLKKLHENGNDIVLSNKHRTALRIQDDIQ